MRKFSTLIGLCLFCAIAGTAQVKYFKGELKGSNEVPANASTGLGVVLAEYNINTNQLELRGDYQGLTSAISASHIHNAAVGLNGPVMYNITNTGLSSGSLSLNTTLTEAQEIELLAGRVYANVHNASFPGGELRTQLIPATVGQSRHLHSDLNGSNEVPANASGATGVLYGLLDKGENKLYVTGLFGTLGSNATAAHIHTAAAGVNGPVTFPLHVTTGLPVGVFSTVSDVSPAQITSLETSNTYCNVHSTGFAGGEIRGQLAVVNDPQIVYFKGLLSGSEQVPANAATGFGVVLVQYDLGTNNFILTGDYQGLSSVITGSHVHNAAAGVNGPVIYNINNTGLIAGNLLLNTNLTDAQETELLAGRLYTNVHTSINAGGEIRAQLTATTEGQTTLLSGLFSGSQEVPANASAGAGALVALLDKGTSMLYVSGTFNSLGSASTAAHIHTGAPGTNGPVMFPLNFTPGFALGVLSLSTSLTLQQISTIESGGTYANIHTVNFAGGEIRAQIMVGSVLPVKLVSFNGYRNHDKVDLVWSVENQRDFKDFTIEQLNNRSNQWMQKGTVAANGLSGVQRYSFTDMPGMGSDILLYRLKLTDLDGKLSYSSVVKINFRTARPQLTLLSNPIKTGVLQFQLTGTESMNQASAAVQDMSGRVLATSGKLSAGTNSMDIANLPAGVYKLVITTSGETITASFLK